MFRENNKMNDQFFYVDFENRFYASRDVIKEKLKVYLPFVNRLAEIYKRGSNSIVGNINELKPIIAKYQSKATQIFFPYPKVYKAYKANTSKSSGQLLMIFMTNNINM